jgi:4-amino-4-deoxy-L-arabinose transferase-like glycosyltransferase
MRKPGQYFNDSLSLILATLVALSLLGAWLYAKESPGIDYYVTWVAADAVKNGTRLNIYEASSRYALAVEYRNKADALDGAPNQKLVAGHLKELQMTATPFLYWVTGVFASGDYENDLVTWQFLSLLLVTMSILVLCRVLGHAPSTGLVILLAVLVWFMPLYSNLRVANVNGFQLGLISLALWLLNRRVDGRYLYIAGLLTGLLVMFKPNLAPVALLFGGAWVVRRQYVKLALCVSGMATGAILAMLVSSIWLGNASAWLDWFYYIRQFVDGGPGESGGNYAIITRVFGATSPLVQLMSALFLCLLCLVLFWWGRRCMAAVESDRAGKDREYIENAFLIAMGCLIPLLTSTLVWLHYYLLTIPMIIIALRPWREADPMKIIPLLMLRVLPVVALVILLETALKDITGGEGRSYIVFATTTSAICLFVVGLWQLWRGVRDESSR